MRLVTLPLAAVGGSLGLPMGFSWVDTHCHLQLDRRPPGDLLDRAEAVEWVVVPGVDLSSSGEALALASSFPGRVLGTAGLHPHDATQWPEQAEGLARLAEKAVAVGETGLDFYRNLAPRQHQLEAFRDQLGLAEALHKPIVVHCRDAFDAIYEVLMSEGPVGPVVLHCWTGGPRWTRRFLELPSTVFSFAGPLAFETGDTVRRGAALVPPDRAMVETDTPYLSPPPYRGEQNEPARVALVGDALAVVWGCTSEEVATSTSATADRVFR
ncbi:MAG TPA: TatD family hydrolase [Acidimicrobiia bacterium]|nr:TatD family hydrolase [Acidimicrobiia bacterium]